MFEKRFIIATLLILFLASLNVSAELVAWYKLDDPVGSGDFNDSSGNGYHGGIHGPNDFTGESFYFNRNYDGENYLFTPVGVPVDANSSFTWAVWVKSSGDPNAGSLIQKGDNPLSGWEDGYKLLSMIPPAEGGSAFNAYGYYPATAPTSFQDGQWHHLAAVFDDAGCMYIYLDGVLDVAQGMNLKDANDNGPLFFFGGGAHGWFHGEMKDIRLYDEALREVDILELAGYTAPVAWYKLDDPVGSGDFKDSSGNGYDGGIHGPNDFTGESFYFNRNYDGENYLFTPVGVPVPATNDFTWAVWVKSSGDPDGFGSLIQKGNDPLSGWEDGYKLLSMISPASGGSQFDAYGYFPATAPTPFQDGQWHHLAAVFDDAGCMYIYLDGVLDVAQGMNLKDANDNGPLFFFGSGTKGSYKGEMKDIRLYDERLSVQEIQKLAGYTPPPLVAWYKLDDPVGSGDFKDSSGNGYHGGICPGAGSDFTGTSYYFNGNSYLFTATKGQPAYPPVSTQTDFSWTVWVKSSSGGNGSLVTKTVAGGPPWTWVSGSTDMAMISTGSSFEGWGEPAASGTTNIQDGQWHHVAAVFDDAGTGCGYLYVDGVLEKAQGMILAAHPDLDQFFFGCGACGWLQGEMKDIRLYDVELTSDEIADLAGNFPGDLDDDHDVDYNDLDLFTQEWLNDYTAIPGTVTPVENGDFEAYDDDPCLTDYWEEFYYAGFLGSTSNSEFALITNPADAHAGSQALCWDYNSIDTSGGGYSWTEILYVLDTHVDISQYDLMKVWIKRHAGNSHEDLLYMKLLDAGDDVGNIAAEAHIYEAEGSSYGTPDQWYEWVIDLHNMDVYHDENGYWELADIDDVSSFMFGCSDAAGGTGTIDIDDITLVKLPQCSQNVAADINGDCVINFVDFAVLAEDWLKDID